VCQAASSRDSSSALPWAGAEPADEWRRGSRNYLEAKRALREVRARARSLSLNSSLSPSLSLSLSPSLPLPLSPSPSLSFSLFPSLPLSHPFSLSLSLPPSLWATTVREAELRRLPSKPERSSNSESQAESCAQRVPQGFGQDQGHERMSGEGCERYSVEGSRQKRRRDTGAQGNGHGHCRREKKSGQTPNPEFAHKDMAMDIADRNVHVLVDMDCRRDAKSGAAAVTAARLLQLSLYLNCRFTSIVALVNKASSIVALVWTENAKHLRCVCVCVYVCVCGINDNTHTHTHTHTHTQTHTHTHVGL